MDSLRLEKRLIVAEDINFDYTGTNETVQIDNGSGGKIEAHKVNAGHMPLGSKTAQDVGANNVDKAIAVLNTKLGAISVVAVQSEDKTVLFDAADTEADIQAKIDGELRNLGGHTLTFEFPELLDRSLLAGIDWSNFYNGVLVIEGNGINVSDAAELEHIFGIRDCQCRVIVRNFNFTHHNANTKFAIDAARSAGVEVKDCTFHGIARQTYALKLKLANGIFDSCTFDHEMKTFVEGVLGAGGGGGGNPMFTIFPSLSTENPEGAEKLDGHTLFDCLDTESKYYDFFQKAVELRAAGKIPVKTAVEYTAELEAYGQCGSFVIDTVAGSIRLPKLKSFIQNVASYAPTTSGGTVGTVHSAGLPNISGTIWGEYVYGDHWNQVAGAFYKTNTSGKIGGKYGDYDNANIGFDASRCDSAYGAADTVQPESIEVCYYIQVAPGGGSGSGAGDVYVSPAEARTIARQEVTAGNYTISGAVTFLGGITVSGAIVANQSWVNGNYLALSGGTVTGNLGVEGMFTANNGGYIREVSSSRITSWSLPSGGAFSGSYIDSYGGVWNEGLWGGSHWSSASITSTGEVVGSYWYSIHGGEDDEGSGSIDSWPASASPTFLIDSSTGVITASLWGSSVEVPPDGNGAFVFSSAVQPTSYYDSGEGYDVFQSGAKILSGAIVAVSSGGAVVEEGAEFAPVSGGAVMSSWHTSGGTVITDAKLNVSGGKLLYKVTSGGSTKEGNLLDGGGSQSGAIVSGAEFSTTVGGYTVELTSGGGLAVSGSGASVVLSGGQIAASGGSGGVVIVTSDNEENQSARVSISGGVVKAVNRDNDGIIMSNGTTTLRRDGVELIVDGGGVNIAGGMPLKINGREAARQLVTETTSVSDYYIDVLSGGTSYLMASPLYSLEVNSVAKSTEASYIHFTLDSVTAPTPVVISGYTFSSGRFEGGKEYLVGFFDGMAVVNEVTSGGVLQ